MRFLLLTKFVIITLAASCQTFAQAQLEDSFALLDNYFNATSWMDRVQFVDYPERVLPIMRHKYENQTWKRPATEFNTKPGQVKWKDAATEIVVTVDGLPMVYYIRKKDNSLKIDWEASNGVSEISVAKFKATKPSEAKRFRVTVSLSDYYPTALSKLEQSLWSLDLSDANNESLGWCFIRRDTLSGQSIFDAVQDGKEHRAVVNLHYIANLDYPIVDEVFKVDSWLLPDYEALAAAEEQEENDRTAARQQREAELIEKSFRTWHSSSGKFSVEARFKGSSHGVGILLKRDGTEIKVAIDNLSDKDKAYIKSDDWKIRP